MGLGGLGAGKKSIERDDDKYSESLGAGEMGNGCTEREVCGSVRMSERTQRKCGPMMIKAELETACPFNWR